jgi:hypothetical protein
MAATTGRPEPVSETSPIGKDEAEKLEIILKEI